MTISLSSHYLTIPAGPVSIVKLFVNAKYGDVCTAAQRYQDSSGKKEPMAVSVSLIVQVTRNQWHCLLDSSGNNEPIA